MVGGRRTGWLLACFAVLVTASLWAADPPNPLKDATKAAVAVAEKEQVSTVLIVVRIDPDSAGDLEPEAILAGIADDLQKLLEAGNLAAVVCKEKVKADGKSLTPTDVAAIPEVDRYEAVLGADYRRKGGTRQLRMALVTQQKKLWARTLALGSGDAKAKKKSNSTTQVVQPRNGNGRAALNDKQLAAAAAAANMRMFTNSPTGLFQEKSAGNALAEDEEGPKGCENEAGSSSKGGTQPDLNKKVLAFALANIGKQVGNGECWTLADEALKAAGAKPAQGYTFGKPIDMAEIVPGDILQFTSARFDSGNSWMILGMPNHTAIVYTVKDKNKVFVLHQNFGQRIVVTTELDFGTMVSGEVQAFRPELPERGRGR